MFASESDPKYYVSLVSAVVKSSPSTCHPRPPRLEHELTHVDPQRPSTIPCVQNAEMKGDGHQQEILNGIESASNRKKAHVPMRTRLLACGRNSHHQQKVPYTNAFLSPVQNHFLQKYREPKTLSLFAGDLFVATSSYVMWPESSVRYSWKHFEDIRP